MFTASSAFMDVAFKRTMDSSSQDVLSVRYTSL